MTKLEEFKPNAVIRGMLSASPVTVIDVQWFALEVIEVTYKDSGGRVGLVLRYRNDEPRLEFVEAGQPWGFHGDGASFGLVSEAHRIRLGACQRKRPKLGDWLGKGILVRCARSGGEVDGEEVPGIQSRWALVVAAGYAPVVAGRALSAVFCWMESASWT